MNIRPGRDSDSPALIDLIGTCWSEYPGCVMDLDENPNLVAPDSYYAAQDGTITVAEDEAGRVVACVATLPAEAGALELKGLYVDVAYRGTGLAVTLLRIVEQQARDRDAPRLILWSDTRFTRAHRFYERQGFISAGAIRALHDRSNSLEYPYAKPMTARAVEPLDAAAVRSAVRALSAIAADEPTWQQAASDIAAGTVQIHAAWYQGTLSGALILDLPSMPGATHRADLRLLHIQPSARRIGLGTALLAAAEQTALTCGRTLITASADAGAPAASFLAEAGYHQAGRLPGYTHGPGDRPIDLISFWRTPAQDRAAGDPP